MNNSALDKHIKEKLGDSSPDVPSHIWENIIAEREKRKPAGIWFGFLNRNMLLLLLGIIAAGTGIIIYRNINSSNNNTNNKEVEITKSINAGKISGKETGNVSTETTKINNVENTAVSNDHTKNDVDNKKDLDNINEKGSVINYKQHSKSQSLINAKTNISQSLAADNTNKRINNNIKRKKTKSAVLIRYNSPGVSSDNDDNTELAEINTNDLFLNSLLLNLDMLHAQRTIAAVKKPNNPNLNIPCPEAEKNAAGNKTYFEIYGGPDYAFRKISDTGNSAYLQKRKESTTFSSAFSVGLRYTKVFSNGISFRTGVNYSQINEKFKFAQGNIIQLVYVTDSNGDTTGSYTTTSTRYKVTHNKFRTIDLPLLVGYEMGNGRLHANFNLGVVVNLYSWQNGDILDMAYQPVNVTTGKTSSPYQFKTNVGLGFMAGASVYYKLTDRLHILAEPYFRYNFSPASKSELTLKEKYNTLGLRLGLRLDF